MIRCPPSLTLFPHPTPFRSELLGMSRTPVRQALPVLAQEGLLTEHQTRGYVVRGFSTADVLDAIDLRGVLEGLAARRVDRKSTRLNSSHLVISYAVFCLITK